MEKSSGWNLDGVRGALTRHRGTPFPARKDPSQEAGGAEEQPLQSLVYLLESPREISGDLWIRHVAESLGIDLLAKNNDATAFVKPLPPPGLTPRGDDCDMLKIPERVFWIFHVKRPYVEDPASAKPSPPTRLGFP